MAKLPEILFKILGYLPAAYQRAKHRIVYRAAGVPRLPLTVVEHQSELPRWHTEIVQPMYRMALACNWIVTNVYAGPVAVTNTRLQRPRIRGLVELYSRKLSYIPGQISNRPILQLQPGETGEVECRFWIIPPLHKPPDPVTATVVLVDQFGNKYTFPNVVFRHEFPVNEAYMKAYFPI
jgi:hypothetical protein